MTFEVLVGGVTTVLEGFKCRMGMLLWAVARALCSTTSTDGHTHRFHVYLWGYAGFKYPIPDQLGKVWATDPKVRDHRGRRLWVLSSVLFGEERGIGSPVEEVNWLGGHFGCLKGPSQ
ncbi:hypothetical protein J6590_009034 [Homalodisca vitripennis]|nr:hypothetical protein J6590_009034 [Homalodisca vitripennis]